MLKIGKLLLFSLSMTILNGCIGPSEDQAVSILRDSIEHGKLVDFPYDAPKRINIKPAKTPEFGNIPGTGNYYFKVSWPGEHGEIVQEIWDPVFEKQNSQWVLGYLYYIEEEYPYEWVQREVLP